MPVRDVDPRERSFAMQKISPQQIRASFVNASRSETAKLTLPQDFESLEWENLDFLGWRDPKMPLRGYLVLPSDRSPGTSSSEPESGKPDGGKPDGGKPIGVLLRAPEGGARKNRSVLCELCRDVFSKEDVLLWVARRAGQPGRDGNTVGTLICADFLCSTNVRKEPPANEINPDPAAVVLRQIGALVDRTAKFVQRVRAA